MSDKPESAAGISSPSTALLAEQFIEAVSIAAHLSRDIREGESIVGWVKRVIHERETARAAFERVIALGQCATEQTGARLTDCQNVAMEWLQTNAEGQRP